MLDAQACDEISSNQGKLVGKPAERLNPLRALEPVAVERLRRGFHRRGSTLVAVLAYAGLRPCEALALTWGDVRPLTLMVDGRTPAGVRDHTSVAAVRGVRLFPSVAEDLDEWRRESGDPGDEELVFPGRRGAPWDDRTWRKWRRRRFAPAVAAASLPAELRPYDLRDTLAMLLITAGDAGARDRAATRPARARNAPHVSPADRRGRRGAAAVCGRGDQGGSPRGLAATSR